MKDSGLPALVAACLLSLLPGCVSSGYTLVGKRFSSLPQGEPVKVYESAKEVVAPFDVVANLRFYNAGKWEHLRLDDAVPKLKEWARKAGGNAVIIDEQRTVYSGLSSRGIDVKARAVRLASGNQEVP